MVLCHPEAALNPIYLLTLCIGRKGEEGRSRLCYNVEWVLSGNRMQRDTRYGTNLNNGCDVWEPIELWSVNELASLSSRELAYLPAEKR